MALRIGVVGNRELNAVDAQRQRDAIRDVLSVIAATCTDLPSDLAGMYAAGPPLLRVVTPIAEGADRLGAAAAIELGFELDCILPFERTQFALDFESEASRSEYESLLGKARAVLELDGSRESARTMGAAYAAASEHVLGQSDVLIALWTGAEPKGPGGTGLTVDAALGARMPVVWINADDPGRVQIPDDEGNWAEFTPDGLREQLLRVLAPRSGAGDAARNDRMGRETYFRERAPGLAPLNLAWRAFQVSVLREGARRLRPRQHRFERDAYDEWEAGWAATPRLPEAVRHGIDGATEGHFAWADSLSSYYANQYRSTFVMIYLLGLLAVFLAVLGQAVGIDEAGGSGETFKAGISLATILAILGLRVLGSRRRWHDRWIDYRLLAEFFRHLRFLAPLSLSPPRVRQPVHRSAHDPGSTWMGWHARAVARELGVVPATLDTEYLQAFRALLRDAWVGQQLAYHERNSAMHKRMEHRLGLVGTLTFIGTIGGIVLLLLTKASEWTLVTAVLPAVGASLAGIRSQGEMERVGRRSEAIALGLDELRRLLDRVVVEEANGVSVQLSRIAETLTLAMTDDVLDWRIVFDARQLEAPPGGG